MSENVAQLSARPSRPLDFVVVGTGRSGTSALVRGINAHPKIGCAHELFGPGEDHTEIVFPQSFVSRVDEADPVQRRELDALLSKKELALVGNKTPDYWMRLDRVLAGVPHRKVVYAYRPADGVARSWSSRGFIWRNWRAGKVGVFGAAEVVMCAAALATVRADVLVFPYAALRGDQRSAFADVARFLAPDLDPWPDEERLRAADSAGEGHLKRMKMPLLDPERRVIEEFRIEELDALMNRPAPFPLEDVREDVLAYLRRMPPNLPNLAARIAGEYSSREVNEFRQKWVKHVTPAWNRARARIEAPAA